MYADDILNRIKLRFIGNAQVVQIPSLYDCVVEK